MNKYIYTYFKAYDHVCNEQNEHTLIWKGFFPQDSSNFDKIHYIRIPDLVDLLCTILNTKSVLIKTLLAIIDS